VYISLYLHCQIRSRYWDHVHACASMYIFNENCYITICMYIL